MTRVVSVQDAGAPDGTAIDRLDQIIALPEVTLPDAAPALAEELIAIGEGALESWLVAKGANPTRRTVEGFRLLALHRQGARGDPTFNACRETCRELAYLYNVVRLSFGDSGVGRHVRLGAMVARHLVLFIDGKLESAGFGEFCCSSRPIRQRDAASAPPKGQ